MLKITLLFALIVTVISVQTASQELSDFNEPILESKADDYLKKLKVKVDEAIVRAQAALDKAKADINAAAASVQADAKKQMQSTVDALKTQLDALKKKATDLNVDIGACIDKDEPQLLGLPDQYSGDLVHCVSDRINEGVQYAQNSLDEIKKIVTEIENIKKEVDDCGGGWNGAKCKLRLAAKIEGDIVSFPTKIEANVVATVALIQQLDDRIKKCASDRTNELPGKAQAIFDRMAACIAIKLIPH